MFRKSRAEPLPDFSASLREPSFYKYAQLHSLALGGEITALAQDPVLSLLALGTSSGEVHVYGSEGFRFVLPVTAPGRRARRRASSAASASTRAPSLKSTASSHAASSLKSTTSSHAASTSSRPPRPPPGIKFLTFHPGSKLVAIDDEDTLYQYDLTHVSDSPTPALHPPLPVREAAHSLVGGVVAVENPSPSHSWLFLGMRDGSVRAWDLKLGRLAEFRIPNLWQMHEEKLRRSGVERERSQSSVIALAMNPRDLNVLLVGYTDGIVAYDFRQAQGIAHFEAVHAPGSPGGGSYANAERLWSERAPPVTTLAWRDDGLVFCAGHADGCLSFWALSDEKPLQVRTLTHEDVNIADAEALVAAGALHTQLAAKADGAFENAPVVPPAVADREPIFKLAWASFSPGTGSGADPAVGPARAFSERGESLLLVLGGQASGEKPGISVLQLPAFQPPPAAPKGKQAKVVEGLSRAERAAYRASLMPTGASAYRSKTPPEDFLLLSSSPYFGQARDPTALVVLLTPDPRLPPCGTDRELEAYAFPPVRSDVAPPVLGRNDFALPGEGDVMAQQDTPAPRARRASIRRFPWSAPERPSLLSSRSVRRARNGALAGPSGTWAGGSAVLGAKLVDVPMAQFQRLLAGLDGSRVPLNGGLAVPDFKSQGAPDPAAHHEAYRVVVSWHADCTVRFHDVSEQLLLQVPLAFEYPNPLGHLTVDVARIFRETGRSENRRTSGIEAPAIVGVEFASESLECAVALSSGQIVVCKFAEGTEARASMSASESPAASPIVEETDPIEGEKGNGVAPETEKLKAEKAVDTPSQVQQAATGLEEKMEDVTLGEDLEDVNLEEDEAEEPPRLYRGWDGRYDERSTPSPEPEPLPPTQVIDLAFLAKLDVDSFRPVSLFNLSGRVSALALSDIGFIGVGYGSQLVMIDMRGPRVMHVEVLERPIVLLKWAVCGVGSDASPKPRLFAVCDGATRIFPLVNQKGWSVGKSAAFSSLDRPIAAFILDPETGAKVTASPAAFAASLLAAEPPGHRHSHLEGKKAHCVYVAASNSKIRTTVNVTGDRVSKADVADLTSLGYVTHNGGRVFVGLTPAQALCFSAPTLEPITRLSTSFIGETAPEQGGTVSFDASGDYLEYVSPTDISLKTLFAFRKPLPPRIDPTYYRVNPGGQPQPLSAGVFSWMWANAPLTGAGLDAIVGGPERVVPKTPAQPKQSVVSWAEPPQPQQQRARSGSGTASTGFGAYAGAAGGMYSELQQKFAQRGEVMSALEESVGQLANSTQSFVEAARRAAMAESAKSSARSFFKF